MEDGPSYNYLEHTIPLSLLAFFSQQATQKIQAEGWAKQGRNVEVKVQNFVNCWATEEAFKQLLMQKKAWFRYRGLYFGDAAGAGADFTVRIDGTEVTLGLRSIAPASLTKWKTVAYPDDRFQQEQDNDRKSVVSGAKETKLSHAGEKDAPSYASSRAGGIADYHIVCNREQGHTKFFGVISKEKMLQVLRLSQRLYSRKNQECFRVIPLDYFSYENLLALL